MCLVCIEWQAGRMTKKEVDRALFEIIDLSSSPEEIIHAQELLITLDEENEDDK